MSWESASQAICPSQSRLLDAWAGLGKEEAGRLAEQTIAGTKGHVKNWGLCHAGSGDSGKVGGSCEEFGCVHRGISNFSCGLCSVSLHPELWQEAKSMIKDPQWIGVRREGKKEPKTSTNDLRVTWMEIILLGEDLGSEKQYPRLLQGERQVGKEEWRDGDYLELARDFWLRIFEDLEEFVITGSCLLPSQTIGSLILPNCLPFFHQSSSVKEAALG